MGKTTKRQSNTRPAKRTRDAKLRSQEEKVEALFLANVIELRMRDEIRSAAEAITSAVSDPLTEAVFQAITERVRESVVEQLAIVHGKIKR